MNYGLYLSASGLLTAMHRMDVASNNLANVNTHAFKPDFILAAQRPAERIEDGLFHIDSNTLLDRLGGGALAAPTMTRFTSAAPEPTGNPLDAAILGEGFFIVDATGDGSGDEIKFTRDGRFTLDPSGALVQAATGRLVLDDAGAPITLDPEFPAEINNDGVIYQDGDEVARLQIAAPVDLSRLRKVGENLFSAGPGAATIPTGSFIEPGAIERSGVDPIRAMMDVSNAGRAVTMNSRILELTDTLMNSAINVFGRTN